MENAFRHLAAVRYWHPGDGGLTQDGRKQGTDDTFEGEFMDNLLGKPTTTFGRLSF